MVDLGSDFVDFSDLGGDFVDFSDLALIWVMISVIWGGFES